jgi:RIO kinase 1
MQEAAWQSTELDALFRLADAGVRVPQPYICTDGVLLMELVVDGMGDVAPRLNDVDLTGAAPSNCTRCCSTRLSACSARA